ncbi:MAG: hypothetical protein SGBAC_011681 [Bacillariaceae sp.]
MTLKNLKLRFKKNNSDPSEVSKRGSYIEETEVTLSDEDEAKYSYNTYSNEVQRRSPSPKAAEGRMPRRSSLKGGGGTSTARQSRRRHSLTFSTEVSVSTITPTQELAKKKSSLWFEDKDYEKMRDKIFMIAERAQEGDTRYCTRGLEGIIHRDSETRKYAAWDAVMDEQEYQMESGADYFDEDALSESYRVVCEDSCKDATARALQDEKDVAEYLSETRRYCRRMSM